MYCLQLGRRRQDSSLPNVMDRGCFSDRVFDSTFCSWTTVFFTTGGPFEAKKALGSSNGRLLSLGRLLYRLGRSWLRLASEQAAFESDAAAALLPLLSQLPLAHF